MKINTNYEINETSAGKFKVEEVVVERVTDIWDDFFVEETRELWPIVPRPRDFFEPIGFTGTYTQRRLLGTYDTLEKAREELKKYIAEKSTPPKQPKRIVFDQDGKELSEK